VLTAGIELTDAASVKYTIPSAKSIFQSPVPPPRRMDQRPAMVITRIIKSMLIAGSEYHSSETDWTVGTLTVEVQGLDNSRGCSGYDALTNFGRPFCLDLKETKDQHESLISIEYTYN
jgi:hypothetical protein